MANLVFFDLEHRVVSDFKDKKLIYSRLLDDICISSRKILKKEVDDLTQFARDAGAKGLATLALTAEGVKGTAQKFVKSEEVAALQALTDAREGDLILFIADQKAVANKVIGTNRIANKKNIILYFICLCFYVC